MGKVGDSDLSIELFNPQCNRLSWFVLNYAWIMIMYVMVQVIVIAKFYAYLCLHLFFAVFEPLKKQPPAASLVCF